MNFFIFFFSLFLAIGRNLPFDIYPFGLTLIDIFVLFWIIYLIINRKKILIDNTVRYMIVIFVTTLISMYVNQFLIGFKWSELFEIFRYALLTVLYCFLCMHIKNTELALYGFTIGNLITFIFAYLNPMNPDVQGFVQIYNPNVIGNIMSVNIMLLLIDYIYKPNWLNFVFAILLATCTIFTYSKGAWILSFWNILLFFTLIIFFLKYKKNFAGLFLMIFSIVLFSNLIIDKFDVISNYIESKIVATDFSATATEGGSFSARVGLAYSSILQWSTSPIIGVGISNFEILNYELSNQLGEYFYFDDNPNNVYLYILSGSGIFAFTAWMMLVSSLLIKIVVSIIRKTGSYNVAFLAFASAGFTLLLTGSTQNEMLNGYYFWFLLAFIRVKSQESNTNEKNSTHRSW